MTARPLWKHALACAAVAATLACQGGGAWGQSKSSDPARVQERIEQDRGRAEQPAAPAAISGDRAAPSGAAESVERFTLAAVSFSGMTAFDAADMTAYYERYLATEIDTETLREIVNAIFYVMRGGVAWRLLPSDLPPKSTAYRWFAAWRDGGVFEALNHALLMIDRERSGRPASPSACIIDSQSVKSAEKGGSASTATASTRAS